MSISDIFSHHLLIPTTLGVLLFSFLISSALLVRMHLRLNRLLVGKNARDLEDTIHALHTALRTLQSKSSEHEETIQKTMGKLDRSLAHASIVRFNAFEGVGEGGNQSFATAIVSHQGNGIVLSSIATRDRMRVYAKPLTTFTSSYELSSEEQHAVEDAQKSLRGNSTLDRPKHLHENTKTI
jgi:hypothetical protein